jgi:hypothetical protein
MNLVLLHPCLRSRFLDDVLIRYYAEWLPSWIAEARARMNVKCMQPVEWPPRAGWLSVVHWVPGFASSDDDERPAAEELVRQCLETCAPLLRAVRLSELQNLSASDLDDFCQIEALNRSQRDWLIAKIEARQAKKPRDVFQAIDDYLPDARSRT